LDTEWDSNDSETGDKPTNDIPQSSYKSTEDQPNRIAKTVH